MDHRVALYAGPGILPVIREQGFSFHRVQWMLGVAGGGLDIWAPEEDVYWGAYELRNDLFEGVIVLFEEGNGQHNFPAGQRRDVAGTLMYVYSD